MSEQRVFRDYAESDVRAVIAGASSASWAGIIHVLENGDSDCLRSSVSYTPHMVADAKQAWKDNVPFPRYPDQVYRVLKSHRNPELVRQEEQRRDGNPGRRAEHSMRARRRR